MNKLKKHKLILSRRLNQNEELKKIASIENKTLQNVLNAFKLAKTNTHKKEDIIAFNNCETYRDKLLIDATEITYEIFSLDETALVQDICRKAASKEKWCRFLYYMVKNTENPNILEIGTNLGISGSYMLEAMKGKNGKFITMEGLPQLCSISAAQFSTIVSPSNFEVVQGLYDDTFPKVIEKDITYDLIFIDGNHKKEPTRDYFNALKSKIKQSAIFVFDDIYWSDGMKETWEIIKKDSNVNFSMDMYEQGIVVIDKNESLPKKHFNLHLSY
ncbi:class I SAM-dependent methyltransferase [Algibacter sp. 2305UL17-15]|uniref:O-methyltransferase n=1 Tax=Algibacter sp. 2305UL17-15 TaxID=3231268 RepID=UPI0034580250